jgi:thiamine-phosphate pyrophosphorylase
VIVLPPLYAILDFDAAASRGLQPAALCDIWLEAGIRLIQFRAKHLTGGPMEQLAAGLTERCHAAGARLIVNDRADVARLSGADGVHVGQDDLTPAQARVVVGAEALVGISTHNEEQAREAVQTPVDYLAIGPVFPTSSKDKPDPVVGLDGVAGAKGIAAARGLPLVAIGGITLDNAAAVLEAGASSVAVISDLLAGDPAARAEAFVRLIR